MTLCHYSATPFALDSTRRYQQEPEQMKPNGLWLSAEDDDPEESYGWRQWCEGNDFNLDGLAHRVEVELTADARILRLDSAQHIRWFTREYGRQPLATWDSLRAIDWCLVASRHQGILIAPYQWECRLDRSTFWYYPWDCASACVWDASCVVVKSFAAAPLA